MSGIYDGALTREQFMFLEMRKVAQMTIQGMTEEEILSRVYDDNLFQYPTQREIKSKCRACLKRVAQIKDMPRMMEALAEGLAADGRLAALIALMLQNRLVAEFMVGVVGEKYRTLDYSLTRKDMNLFLMRLAEQDENVAGWSEQTVKRIRGVLHRCLTETGYLDDMRTEKLNPVLLPMEMENELREKLGCEAVCYMADPAVAEAAKQAGTTRAVAAMHRAAREHRGAILAVGNAPTALLTIAEEIEAGLRPALVIGVPVGFVNVVESKETLFAICEQHGVPAIAAMGRKGGSNVAAAICNALVYSAAEMLDPSARGWRG